MRRAAAAWLTLSPRGTRRRARERRLFWLLLGVWMVNLFDLAMTLTTWRHSLLVELNPIAALILPHGMAAIVGYKLGLLVIGTGMLWYCRHHRTTEPAVWIYAVLCVGLSLWWRQVLVNAHSSWAVAEVPARAFHMSAQHE